MNLLLRQWIIIKYKSFDEEDCYIDIGTNEYILPFHINNNEIFNELKYHYEKIYTIYKNSDFIENYEFKNKILHYLEFNKINIDNIENIKLQYYLYKK